MMPHPRLLLLSGLALTLPAVASAMPVGEFLPRAERLKAKGPAAMFSSDLKPIMGEMKRVTTSYRADLARSKAKGETPRSCPPAGKMKLDPGDFLSALRSVPASQRGIDMTEAFHRYMATKFPCSSS